MSVLGVPATQASGLVALRLPPWTVVAGVPNVSSHVSRSLPARLMTTGLPVVVDAVPALATGTSLTGLTVRLTVTGTDVPLDPSVTV